MAETLEIPTPHGDALVALDTPEPAPVALLVLGHGAGGGIEARDLVAVRDGALARALAVARVVQPYRVAGRRAPAPARQLDAVWEAVVVSLRARRGTGGLTVLAGGRSSGARVACRTAASLGVAGVLCLAFPLHPPGRPERSRADELTGAGVPVLVLQGERDPFGRPGELPRGPRVLPVPGADHGFARGAELTERVGQALDGLLDLAGLSVR